MDNNRVKEPTAAERVTHKMKQVGLSESQIPVLIDAMKATFMTKDDFSEFQDETRERFARMEATFVTKDDFSEFQDETRERFARIEANYATKDDLSGLRNEMREQFAKVDDRFTGMENRLTRVEHQMARADTRMDYLATKEDVVAAIAASQVKVIMVMHKQLVVIMLGVPALVTALVGFLWTFMP